MIRAKLNLNMDMIKSSVRGYSNSTNLFYEASYDLIKNKIFGTISIKTGLRN
jgi:hypothetical protein